MLHDSFGMEKEPFGRPIRDGRRTKPTLTIYR